MGLVQERGSKPADTCIDADELALTTSPSILMQHRCAYQDVTKDTKVNCLQNAIKLMIAGPAPGVEHVRLFWYGSSELPGRQSKPAWSGFFPRMADNREVASGGRLRSFTCTRMRKTDHLATWARDGDFAQRRSLAITHTSSRGLELMRLSLQGNLNLLHSLVLQEVPDDSQDLTVLQTVLASMKPLSKLVSSGHLTDLICRTALDHHGPTLRHLMLRLDKRKQTQGSNY